MKKTMLFCILLAVLTLLAPLALAEDEVYIEVPSFASYAGEYVTPDEELGEGVYYMSRDIADQLIDGFFTLLQEKYGFSGLQRGVYKNFSVHWLSESSHRFTGRMGCPLDEGNAEGPIIILRSDYEDGTTGVIVRWGDHIGRIDTGDRFQPQSSAEETAEADVYVEVPSFGSYAGEYLETDEESSENIYYMSSDIADQLIDGYFTLLQEQYGFSGLQHGTYEQWSLTWLLESGHSATGLVTGPLDEGEAEGAFILMRLDGDDKTGVLVGWGDHIGMVDTGDRFTPQESTEETEKVLEVPSFASYAGDYAVADEDLSSDGYSVCFMSSDVADQLIDGYFTLLQDQYGFSGLQRGTSDGISFIWLQESGNPATECVSWSLDEGEAEGPVIMMRSDYAAGKVGVIMLWDKHIDMIDIGDRFQPQSSAEETAEADVYVEVPSFGSYAGKYATVDEETGIFIIDRNVADQLIDGYFGLLQEKYGFSGLHHGLNHDEDDEFSVTWLSGSGNARTGLISYPLDEGEAEGAVIIIRIDGADKAYFLFGWGDHIGMIDSDEHFQPKPGVEEAAEAEVYVVVPSFDSYASDYAKVSENDENIFYVSSDVADQLIDGYFTLLQDEYHFSGLQHGTYEDLSLTWLLESGHNATGRFSGPLDEGTFEASFLLVRADSGDDTGIMVRYGDHIGMIDTGDRFQPQTKPSADTSNRKLLASAMEEKTRKVTKDDNTFIQDIVPYCGGRLSYKTLSTSNDHNVRNVSGSAADRSIIDAYVDLLLASNPYLKLVDEYDESYNSGKTFFSYAIDYTGSEYVGGKVEQTYTDNMCNVMIYGSIESGSMKCAIWTPRQIELLDLGKRYRSGDADVSIGGQSALCSLYQTADGAYETSDGRLRTRLGEAMVLRDGDTYTTAATFEREGNRERLWMRDFYRNETLHFSVPAYSLVQDDLLRLADVRVENSWIRDGRMDGESDFSYPWTGPFLGINHGGDWMTVGNTEGCEFKDATIRVMYMDEDMAVYYLYAAFKTRPYEVEALCAVPLRATVVNPTANTIVNTTVDADYVTSPGQSIEIHYDESAFVPTFELYQWEVLSGSSLVSLEHTKSATCILTALDRGVVRLRMTYQYGKREADVLTGNETTSSRTKTKEYTVLIQ